MKAGIIKVHLCLVSRLYSDTMILECIEGIKTRAALNA